MTVESGITTTEAISAASDGTTLVLTENSGIGVLSEDKNITIDFNGQTLSDHKNATGIGTILATSGTLTLTGEGTVDGVNATDYAIAVWAKGDAVVNITGGTYINASRSVDDEDEVFDLIYASGNATINISGGTFIGVTPGWTLNVKDADFTNDNAHIIVTGGRFYKYDPSNSDTEPVKPVSFVAEGYHVTQDGDYYVVEPD